MTLHRRFVLFFFQPGNPANYWFKLSMAGRISNNIHINASENVIKQQLQNMTEWYCHYQTPPERAYYYNGFESGPQDPEWGERVFQSRPNCGRFSLKNPRHLFHGGRSKDQYGRTLKGYDVAKYKQVLTSLILVFNNLIFLLSYSLHFLCTCSKWLLIKLRFEVMAFSSTEF